MLRRILLTSAGATALTGAALAADLPIHAPPPVYVPPPSWTGFYAGLNAGGTWSGVNIARYGFATVVTDNEVIPGLASTSAALATTSAPLHPTAGFIGGGQIGYNYQFYNSFLAGVEADIQGTSSDFRAQGVFSQAAVAPGVDGLPISQDIASSQSVDWLGTVRGRLGFLFTPTLLVYGTGGFAYGQTNSITSITQFVTGIQPCPMLIAQHIPVLIPPPPATVWPDFPIRALAGRPAAASNGCSCPIGASRSNISITISAASHYNAGALSNFTAAGVLATWVIPSPRQASMAISSVSA